MDTTRFCPADEELRAFSIGHLMGAKLRAVRAHLGHCLRCRGLVSALEATDKAPGLDDESGAWSETGMESTATACPTANPSTFPLGGAAADDEVTGWVGDASKPNLSFLGPPRRPNALGRIGTYDILNLLGQGGMGMVFRGYDSALHRVVAVKVLAPRLAASRRARKQFLREARSAAAINHPNVVTIHAVDVQRGKPYLVMECIPGRSLRERIREGPRLTPEEVLRISLQIASGLNAAHAQGVIHRDIKPANIMLEDQVERVKITDFGLALAGLQASEVASLEAIVGTPAYMSPEQVRGEVLDPRSDLFSLGSVMYAMVAGLSPFQGAHPLDTVRRVADEEPVPLSRLAPSMPKELTDLVMRLLSKNPAQRPGSASEVAEAIRNQLAVRNRQNGVIEKTCTIPIASLRRRQERRQLLSNALSIIGALALTVVILGAAILALLPRPTPTTPPGQPGGLAAEPNIPTPAPRLIPIPAPIPDPPPHTALVQLVTADGATANVRGLSAAIKQAGPGSTLRLLDEGAYAGPFAIDDPERLRGLTIEGRPGAVLVAPKPAGAVLRISGVPDVTLRDLEVRSVANQFALQVQERVPGLLVEDVRFRKPSHLSDDFWSHVWLAHWAQGTAEQPIRFRGATFTPWPTGLVLEGNYGEVAHVAIEGCRFQGISLRQIELIARVRDVRITGCLFVTGHDGIYLDNLGKSGDSGRIEVHNNSFFDVERWVNATTSQPELEGMAFVNNAILGAETTETDVQDGPLSLSELQAKGWRFVNNLCESAPGEDVPALLATPLPDLGVTSRDPDSIDFLRPGLGSPLVGAGAGGEWPDYVGARPPGGL